MNQRAREGQHPHLTRITCRRQLSGDRWPVIEAFVGDPRRWLPLPAVRRADGRFASTLQAGPFLRDVQVQVGPPWSLPDLQARHVRWSP
ncbi:MAG TPA: hypothetical protein VHF25_06275, partial [Nitriliruptorales bacterium]|nr:hypothetical protein [Nitriliruptorales bacterium]